MPFTFAHPAAVLPLRTKKNTYTNFSALVLGSMAPDFEYFIHFRPYQVYGHTILGQIFYNLPLVIIVYLVFNMLIKEPLIINLPAPLYNQYSYLLKNELRIKTLRSFFVFIYSALLGMFTHLLWDSFTHKEGYFVKSVHFFSNTINIIGHKFPLYKVLQHGSSIIGMLILLLYTFMISRKDKKIIIKANVNKKSQFIYWISIVFIQFVIACTVIIAVNDFSLGRIVVSLMSSGMISLFLTSVFNKCLKTKFE